MVMLRLKRLMPPRNRDSRLSRSVQSEIASMARADALEAFVKERCRKNPAKC